MTAPSLSGPPPERVAIRASRPADAEAIAAMSALPGFRAGTLRLPYPSPEAARRLIDSRPEGDLGLVAEIEAAVVGSAHLRRHGGRRGHAAEIGMGVHDDFVGRGVGKALLAAIVDASDRWLAVRRLELTVFADNARALRLYRGFGFEVEGTLREFAFRDGRYVDALVMARLRAAN